MHEHLRNKGWTQEEIEHLQKHFNPQKEGHMVVIFGLSLVAIAVLAVPWAYSILGYLMVGPLFHIILGMVGLPLGAILAVLLTDLDRLDHRHHLTLLLAMPAIAIFASAWLFSAANSSAPVGAPTHNALIGAIIYALTLIIPYGFLVISQWNSLIGQSST